MRDKLRAVAEQKQKQSGVYEDICLESGLAVLVRWAEVMKGVEPQLGRYLVPRVDLDMKGPNRKLEFTVAFRGEDFRTRISALRSAIEDECGNPTRRSASSTRRLSGARCSATRTRPASTAPTST